MNRPEPVRDLDWSPERAEKLGRDVVAMWAEYLEKLPEMPVDRGLKESTVREAVLRDVPAQGMDDDELLSYLRTVVFETSMYPGHPGFMAYVSGSGTVPGAAADLVASFLNQNVGGWRLGPAATEIELALMRWMASCFGLPEGAGGIVQSGGAMATLVCLKAARDRIAGYEVRDSGLKEGPQLAFYCSEEAHVVIARAGDILGLGTDHVRKIPVDERFAMRVDALEQTIEADIAAGIRPAVIAGTAGTTATGAIDPLADLAALAKRHNMWFHVDGAYGGAAVLVPELRGLFTGIEQADSIAFDPHKWLYTPHSGGCAILRDFADLPRSFAAVAAYIHEDKELTQRGVDFSQLSPQFSRGFHALKIWVSLLAHGTDAYARRIGHDVRLASYLASQVEAHPELELMTPASLSICCFRYVPEGKADDEEYLNRLNERLMPLGQLDGRVYLSNAILNGAFCQRACITNFRTEAEHMDAVIDMTLRIGRDLHTQMSRS
jgi:aromatic-L-amino-acid/L-tryptophan decarboxylase